MTPEVRARIRVLLIEGWSYREIARQVGYSTARIWQLRKRMGLPGRYRSILRKLRAPR